MKKLAALAVVLVAGSWIAWRSLRTADKPENRLFFDRPWIDHAPRTETDLVSVFVAITDEPLGVFARQSQWKGEHEFFRYENQADGRVDVVFPQSRTRERVTYAVHRCHQGQFDLCLDVSGNSRGLRRYFSREDWAIGAHAIDRARGGIQLPAALRAPAGSGEEPTQ